MQGPSMEILLAGGKLTITPTYADIADELTEAPPLRTVTRWKSTYEGDLPREIMLELVRYSERIAPNGMLINGKTILEFVESL